jgi:acetoin utilization protein AcuB
MKTRDLMTADPVVVQDDAPLDEAMQLMDEHDVRHLPVLEGKRLCGVLSDRDLLEATGWLVPRERQVLEAPEGLVRDHMNSAVLSVAPDAGLDAVLDALVERRIGCLPVLEGGKLVGIVTEMDLLRAYADACRTERVAPGDDPRLEEVMQREVTTVGPDDGAEEAAALMHENGWRHLPVVQDGELVGIVSDRDIRRERGRGQLELGTVGEIMMPGPVTAKPDERLSSAALVLRTAKVSALPVVERRRLVGLVTLVDVLGPCARALAGVAAT